MEPLPRLHVRIESLNELGNLFKALRAVAASHVLEAQEALNGAREYTVTIEEAIAGGVAILSEDMPRSRAVPLPVERLLIVFCSEHGFAGAFNERLLDHAQASLENVTKLAIVGQRGLAHAKERNLDVAWSHSMATRTGDVVTMTRAIVQHLTGLSSVSVVYGAYQQGGGFEPVTKSILPLNPAILTRATPGNPPLHHLEPHILMERLAGEYLFAQITSAAMESLASENAARLQIMDRADHNIEDKLEHMHRKEHMLGQEQITSELIDAVIGTEAVTCSP
jgi:F-type H+-transporting ATPase subunit gamma